MSTSINSTNLKKFTHDGVNVTKWIHDGVLVFSSGSTVMYYDHNTLLGTEQVPFGEDVLHPSFSVKKAGYTMVGWSTDKNATAGTSIVESLKATNENIDLFAIYVPSSLAVVSGGTLDGSSYSASVNGNFISGTLYSATSIWYHEGDPYSGSSSFTINLKYYSSASVSVGTSFGHGYDQVASYDGTNVSGSASFGHSASGSHILRTSGRGGPWYGLSAIYVRSITLSGPKEWK